MQLGRGDERDLFPATDQLHERHPSAVLLRDALERAVYHGPVREHDVQYRHWKFEHGTVIDFLADRLVARDHPAARGDRYGVARGENEFRLGVEHVTPATDPL